MISKLVTDARKKLNDIDLNLGQKFCDSALQSIDDIIADIDGYVAQNEQMSQYSIPETKSLIESSKQKFSGLVESHKNLHSQVSKYGRLLEKIFTQDLNHFANPQVFNCKQDSHLLDKVTFEHLCSEGLIEAATIFAKEAKLDVKEDIGKIYLRMKTLNNDILDYNCDMALLWLDEECDDTSLERYQLESLLLGLKFCKIIRDYPNDLASKFKILRKLSTVPNIAPNDLKQLASLMILDQETIHAKMLEGFSLNLIKTPFYVSSLFRKVYLNFYGQKTTKPLETAFIIGLLALPSFTEQAKNGMVPSKTFWEQHENFNLDINLPDEYGFHPRFICPVLKVQTNNLNKPHVLTCGHVLSHDAIKSLSTGTSGYDFKCPYCPIYTKKNDSRELLF